MEERSHYIGHRERLRKRFRQAGVEGFQDYEVLELLLTYAIPRKDVKPIAKALIAHFGSLSGVLDASLRELEDVPDLGPASATLIRLVKETCEAYLAEKMKRKDVLSSPQAVVDFSRMKLAGRPNEAFMVIYLNTKNEAIDYEVIQEGTIDRAAVYPRRVLEGALAHRASGLLLVHNHPSGHPEPSFEDKHLTKAVIEAVQPIDIRVLDHIIIGKDGHFSFLENHLLEGLI
ncbi:MAG: DNA repair protein RadC [Candidatus Bipolaricaulia bacterium]